MKKRQIPLGDIIEIIHANIIGHYIHGIPYQPVYMEGGTGIGKTQMMENLLPRMLKETTGEDWQVITMKLSYYSTADILGMPTISRDDIKGDVVKYIKDSLLPRDMENKRGILFLDEIPLVSNGDVRSVLYDLLQNGRMGNDYTLPKGFYVVGAGNRKEDSGIYNGLSPALRDRVMMFEAKFDKLSYINYMKEKGAEKEIIELLSSLPEKDIHSFSADKEDDIYDINEVFSTPRSFEDADNKIKLFKKGVIKDNSLLLASLESVIGEHAYKLVSIESDIGVINKILLSSSTNLKDSIDILGYDITHIDKTNELNLIIDYVKNDKNESSDKEKLLLFLARNAVIETLIYDLSAEIKEKNVHFSTKLESEIVRGKTGIAGYQLPKEEINNAGGAYSSGRVTIY